LFRSNEKGEFRSRSELEAYDRANGYKPTTKEKTYSSSALIIDFQNITDDEINTYSSALSNEDISKNDIKKGILNLKSGGKKYMNTSELLQELRQKQKDNANMEIKQAVGEYYKHHINTRHSNLSLEAKRVLDIKDDRGIL